MAVALGAASLEIDVHHVAGGTAAQLASLRYRTGAGEVFSFTRASYFLSGFGLQKADGAWEESTNSVAWFDAEKQITSAHFEMPSGAYQTLRFRVGLPAHLNHIDISKVGPDDPLHPGRNGLHWSWQGGYVFLALEGMWRRAGTLDGWSYHLAGDSNEVSVILPLSLDLRESARVELDFDLQAALDRAVALSFARDGSSTHSRNGDLVAAALARNLRLAFQVRLVSGQSKRENALAKTEPLYLPEKFTPYRFKTSSAFPIPDLPRDNPLIEERVSLGEKLFYEPRLSRDGSILCASCHNPRAGFADSRRVSIGVEQRTGVRQSMPLLNLAWKRSFFWDGRAPSLRAQALLPIQDHAEMDESLANAAHKLAQSNYGPDFIRAFGSAEINAERIGLALEQFVLTLTSFDSKFDRASRGEVELTAAERRGFELFMTEYDPRRGQFGADCFHCHGGPLFQSQSFANNGLDVAAADAGRAKVTGKSEDAGKFATPSLRNIELTAPYMHDGRFSTIEEVVEHYSSGLKRSETLDPNLAKHPDGGLHLSAADKEALVAFLRTLTDPKLIRPNGPSAATAAVTPRPGGVAGE